MQIRQVVDSFSRDVHTAPTMDAAMDILSATAANLGFEGAGCIYSSQPKAGDGGLNQPSIQLMGAEIDQGWADFYNKKQLYKLDPVYRACLKTTLPVVWSYNSRPQMLLETNRKTTAGEVNAFGTMFKKTGLCGGVSVPIHGHAGGFGYVVFITTENVGGLIRRKEDLADHLLGLSHRFYNAMARKFTLAIASSIKLTARELECLSLLAIGKTLDVTAEILGLSYSTVRFHLHNAERKLGTHSRTYAIAKAAYLGLLGPIR